MCTLPINHQNLYQFQHQYQYLAKYYSEDDEVRGVTFKDAHEAADYSVTQWKTLIYDEIKNINSSKIPQDTLSMDDQTLPF